MAASIARAVEKWPASAQVESYEDLYEVARRLNIEDFEISPAGDRVAISGSAQYQLQKDRLWQAIKQHEGWERDVVVEVTVERDDIRGIHTVAAGETLASIARTYLGRSSREIDIFEANRDRLNDIDQIFPGQQLVIPRRR
jgi:nucleoid-associated protein YgaU